MTTFLITIGVIVGLTAFYLIVYSINQKIPVPEECKIAMADSGCSHCSEKDACVTQVMIQGYFKDKGEEKNEKQTH